jgi:hypothetical protein
MVIVIVMREYRKIEFKSDKSKEDDMPPPEDYSDSE